MESPSARAAWKTAAILRDVRKGSIVSLSTWRGHHYVVHHVHVRTNQLLRTTRHSSFYRAASVVDGWLPVRIVFGVLLYDHAPHDTHTPEWRSHPKDSPETTPVAIVWSDQQHVNVVVGKADQQPEAFRVQVLASLPRPLGIDERLKLVGHPFTVFIAASWSQKRVEFRLWLEQYFIVTQPTNRMVGWEEINQYCGMYDAVIVAIDRLKGFDSITMASVGQCKIKLEFGEVVVFRREANGQISILDSKNTGKNGLPSDLLDFAGIPSVSQA